MRALGKPSLGRAVKGRGYTLVPPGCAGAASHSPCKAVSVPFAVVVSVGSSD